MRSRIPDAFGLDWVLSHAHDLAVEVPVRPVEGRVVYLSRDAVRRLGKGNRARARAHVEKKLLFRTDPLGAFPTKREHARKFGGRKLLADLYVCHGSISLGSGRAVFEGGYQLKGVGRTPLAGFHDYYIDSSGAATLFASLIETANGLILDPILTFGTMACDFVAVVGGASPARKDARTILGRRGSPVRATHLEHLRSSLMRYGRDVREARWLLLARELLEEVAPFPHRFDVDDVVRAGRAFLKRAMVLTAETRLYGLEIAFWADNYDLFGRAFDLGDTDCHFPRIPLASELRRPSRSCAPARFFSALEVVPAPERNFDFSLYPVRSALVSLEILCTEAGLPRAAFDRAFDWDVVDAAWQKALAHVLRRSRRLVGAIDRRRLELPLLHRRAPPTSELDVESLLPAGRKPAGAVAAIGYGRLNAYRRALREHVAEAIGGPALRGDRLPLWSERDLLSHD